MALSKFQMLINRQFCNCINESGGGLTVLPSASEVFPGVSVNTHALDQTKLPCSKYGGSSIVSMFTGPDPGPQQMKYLREVLCAASVPIEFEEIVVGCENAKETDEFAERAVNSMQRNKAAVKSFIPRLHATHSVNATIRKELGLYISLTKIFGYKNIKCKHNDLDMMIIRQNTEGEYTMLEHSAVPGVVESLKVITRDNTALCANWAFKYAQANKRKKISIIHKANIMKLSDGLFLKTVKDVSKKYPDIKCDDMIVDNCSMQLVQNPHQFDILICPNLYGNILVNIACGLIGGAGVLAGENYGYNCAVFEAATRHVPYQDRNENPLAILNAGVELVNYLGLSEKAKVIQKSILQTISEDQIQTQDIGGCNSSDEVVESIKSKIQENMCECAEQ